MVESGLVLPSAPWPSLGELNLDSGAAQVKVSDELCSACQARDIGHLASHQVLVPTFLHEKLPQESFPVHWNGPLVAAFPNLLEGKGRHIAWS